MNMLSNIRTRPATLSDKDFILSLLPRLSEFGPPAWRDGEQMLEVDNQILSDKLSGKTPETALYIAEDDQGNRLGFIHLQPGQDYYNKEKHGHISDVIVAPVGQGKGIGSLLIGKAEEWAHAQGYQWLTLSVFAQNKQARNVYERLGFGEDIIKYVKVLK